MKLWFALAACLSAVSAGWPAEVGRLRLLKESQVPKLADDGELMGLAEAAKNSLEYFSTLPSTASLAFGNSTLPVGRVRESVEHFFKIVRDVKNPAELDRRIRKEFEVYQVLIGTRSRPITFSSYFAPSVAARLKPDREYRYPFYSRPPDLLDLYWEDFDASRKGERIAGRAEGKKFVPYYTREEIDSGKILAGKNLEVAWAKSPLDVLTLQIQGSGWIEVPGSSESYHIRYAGDNGRKYRSVGLRVIELGAIPRSEFNKKRMWDYLHSLGEEDRQTILNYNPRYIFFEITSATTQVRGSLLVSLTDGRSVATDPKLFPQGALAFIKTQKPKLNADLSGAGAEELSRFVFNQDEGGAIKGWNRVDYYAGHGAEAERFAERLWYPGELYFFLKK